MNDDAQGQKQSPKRSRATRVRRVAALSLGLTLGSAAAPAYAIPDTWSDPGNPSLLGSLIIIGGPVLVVLAVITLLTYLPSMMRRGGSGDLSSSDPEWFGGPRTGVRADTEQASDTGGSGGRW